MSVASRRRSPAQSSKTQDWFSPLLCLLQPKENHPGSERKIREESPVIAAASRSDLETNGSQLANRPRQPESESLLVQLGPAANAESRR